MPVERTWPDWLKWHLDMAPFQVMHMRELAESTIAAQDTSAVVVQGGGDKARLPYRVDPADDADNLYANLIILGRHVAEVVGGASPRSLRARMWSGRDEPQGLPVCSVAEAFSTTAEITQWLVAIRETLEREPEVHDQIDHVVDLIRKYRSRYPRAEPKFKSYRPRPCPIPACGEYTIEPVYDAEGLAGYRCDTCEAQWDRDGAPVDRIESREREGP